MCVWRQEEGQEGRGCQGGVTKESDPRSTAKHQRSRWSGGCREGVVVVGFGSLEGVVDRIVFV